MKRQAALLVCLLNLSAPAFAQEAPAASAPLTSDAGASSTTSEAPQVLEVSGVKDPDWKPYRRMLKGLDAFDEFHQQLAPLADLRFVLRPNGAKISFADVTLRIAGPTTSIAIPVAADGTFVIPRSQAAADDNAEMVVNKKKNLLRWRPEIHTPHVPDNARRLGDLRLSCRVMWATEKDDMPFFQRTALATIGGPCTSSMVHLFFGTPRTLVSATLVEGERRLPLPLNKDATGFAPPLHDAKWGNDALVLLEYVPAAPASTAQ